MQYFQMLVGIVSIFLLAFCLSANRKGINFRIVLQLVVLELGLAYGLLNTTGGLWLIEALAGGFDGLLKSAFKGTEFVFGGLINEGQFSFFLNVLMSIVLVSAIIGILKYTEIMPLFIVVIGFGLSKLNGMGRLESFNAVSTLLVGQSENFIAYKDVLSKMSDRRVFSLAAMGMSTVSLSIVGSYMQILEPKYVVTALFLNIFSSFAILSVVNPYSRDDEPTLEELAGDSVDLSQCKVSFFEMLGEYILTGFKIAVIVGAMLVGFIALIDLINVVVNHFTGHNVEWFLGFLMWPLAWLLGVPASEAATVGSIMAMKIISNEFVAMMSLKDVSSTLSSQSMAIISVFLMSFANLSSIGIISGAVRGISEDKGEAIARFGVKLLTTATLVAMLSALVVGIVINF